MKEFDLSNKTALITGGGGLLGPQWAEAIIKCNGKVFLADINLQQAELAAVTLNNKFQKNVATAIQLDVSSVESVNNCFSQIDKLDILVNNAAKDPKVKKTDSLNLETRFETMTYDYWQEGIDAIINGTFLCSQSAVKKMLDNKPCEQGFRGVIVNIASDLAVIAPDQRIYRKNELEWHQQPVKPITYSAAKYAVVGMTKYLATYFAEKGIRVNCLSPTGVFNNHPEEFVTKLSNIIPMGRMAHIDEYQAAMMFLCSNKASSYMTGHNLVIDGGKTVW